ncbi:MAG: TlpA family protein disulfide reductase [Thermoanaerobaculia bacterium]|nr:TlpA family protein disulfide reductase [Thermoanaerobaculia bacterium]
MEKKQSPYGDVIGLALVCVAVGMLAPFGLFTSIMNFPLVVAVVCSVAGIASLVRNRPRVAVVRRSLILAVAVAIAIGGWRSQFEWIRQQSAAIEAKVAHRVVDRPAPELRGLEPINTDEAELRDAADFEGHVTLITFWARWCTPCKQEMPELEELYRRHRDSGLRVVAITQSDEDETSRRRDRRMEAARDFLAKLDITYPAALSIGESTYRDYQVLTIPSTVLIDAEGTLVGYGVGLRSARGLMARATELLRGLSAPGDSI